MVLVWAWFLLSPATYRNLFARVAEFIPGSVSLLILAVMLASLSLVNLDIRSNWNFRLLVLVLFFLSALLVPIAYFYHPYVTPIAVVAAYLCLYWWVPLLNRKFFQSRPTVTESTTIH